jgi:hypothetical protein
MQCHVAGLPGTEDPRIVKAVRAAEKDPGLQAMLAWQREFDAWNLAALEHVIVPQAVLARIAASDGKTTRQFSGKGALMQPVVLAIGIGAAVLLGWGGVTLWNRAHEFPGKDSAMRMVEVNDEMTGLEMEPKKEKAGALNDWFFDKYGFEDYYLPNGFEGYQTTMARLFKQDGQPVAQVAIEDNHMMFYCFKAEDFGVNVAGKGWQTFEDGEWVAAVRQQDEECFMVAFHGTKGDMEDFLKGKE